jgi:hypothetical protein
MLCGDELKHTGAAVGSAQIGGDGIRSDGAATLYSIGGRRQVCFGRSGQDRAGSFGCKGFGDAAADTAATAGDDDYFFCELICDDLLFPLLIG